MHEPRQRATKAYHTTSSVKLSCLSKTRERAVLRCRLTKLGELAANAFQILEKHFRFAFKYETPHRNIDRIAA